MTIKQFLQIVVICILISYPIYSLYYICANPNCPKYLDCGKVISRSTDEVIIKNGTKTELYLNIEFEKTGFRSIECNPTTYFSKKSGDFVCFNLKSPTTIFHEITFMIALFTLIVLCIVLLFGISKLLTILFSK